MDHLKKGISIYEKNNKQLKNNNLHNNTYPVEKETNELY